MTAKKPEDRVLDDLLRKAFADDLPADVAAGMRERLDRVRADIMQDEGRPAARVWIFRRGVWAAASVLMLVSGCVLQGTGVRNPLADRIALIKAELSSFESTRQPGGPPEVRAIAPERERVRTPEDMEKQP
jgi:hypothetical protein